MKNSNNNEVLVADGNKKNVFDRVVKAILKVLNSKDFKFYYIFYKKLFMVITAEAVLLKGSTIAGILIIIFTIIDDGKLLITKYLVCMSIYFGVVSIL